MRVFGYGSLVNTRTHNHQNSRTATLHGHRRVWRHSRLRNVAFLSVEAAPGWQIEGLLTDVPEAELESLNHRERAYQRRDVAEQTDHDGPPGPVIVYEVNRGHLAPPDARHPILLSYIDVVAEGYLDHFGQKGLVRFAASTAGWEAPILDDRSAPVYPRHTAPSPEVLGLVDLMLKSVKSEVRPADPDLLATLKGAPNI